MVRLPECIIDSLAATGAYVPAIAKVEYTTFPAKKSDRSEGRNVLRTKITFADGSVVVVVNSAEDNVDLVHAKHPRTGATLEGVDVASDAAKEHALIYGIAKRIYGTVNEKTGYVEGAGLSSKLRACIRSAVDTNIAEAAAAVDDAELKEKTEAKKAKVAAKRAARIAQSPEAKLDRLIAAVEKLVAMKAEAAKAPVKVPAAKTATKKSAKKTAK